MTKTELIAQLNLYKDNDEVFISNDPEGNEIKTIDLVSLTKLKESDTDYSLVIYPTNTIVNDY